MTFSIRGLFTVVMTVYNAETDNISHTKLQVNTATTTAGPREKAASGNQTGISITRHPNMNVVTAEQPSNDIQLKPHVSSIHIGKSHSSIQIIY